MPTIAQKLCDELVEPVYKPSKDRTAKRSSSKCVHQFPNKQDSNTTRSIIIVKKKEINKLVPHDSGASRTRLKSKETLLKKKFIDIAVNTYISGPLRCDNNCVTLVRKRDNKCNCKCPPKRLNCKASVKQIQTYDSINFSHTDKACAQCIETTSCGTQFLTGAIKPQVSIVADHSIKDVRSHMISGINHPSKDLMRQAMLRDSSMFQHGASSNFNKFSNYMGARRWALSQYPTRGPDF